MSSTRDEQQADNLAGEIDNWIEIIEQSDTGFLGDPDTQISRADVVSDDLIDAWVIELPDGNKYLLTLGHLFEKE
ncbi:MAG TPA: hypothetical protein VH593_11345 [Ktedonobacteraceae bacterium]|jgi:hypothetical protein